MRGPAARPFSFGSVGCAAVFGSLRLCVLLSFNQRAGFSLPDDHPLKDDPEMALILGYCLSEWDQIEYAMVHILRDYSMRTISRPSKSRTATVARAARSYV
jgi:hypothetical protein